MSKKQYATELEEQLDGLTGPCAARAGDRWPTHRAKWRAARRFKTTAKENTDD